MKKFITILLILSFLFAFAGCVKIDSGAEGTLSGMIKDEFAYDYIMPDETYAKNTETDNDEEIITVTDESKIPSTDEYTLDIDGTYTSADDVALYIYLYDVLPDNFMTKDEARELGWTGGGLEDYAAGMCIGGDYFGNYEGLLPKEQGRTYTECDINTLGEDSRGAERIVFSNDGLIFYTDDHYESFVLLYDEDGKAA